MPRFWLCLLMCAGPAAAALQPTTTTLTLASGPPAYGTPLNVRAQVGALQGSITFVVDGQAAKPVAVDVNGGANTLLSLSAGAHTVGASFSASDVYQPSTATPLAVTVAKASTVIGVYTSPAQIGQPLTITATVAIPSSTASFGGTVAFAPAPECGAVPVVYGMATCTIAIGTTGSFTVYAGFSGDSNTTGSTGSLSITVGKVVPGVYVTSAPAYPVWGTASLNALVLGAANLPAPTGTVTFSSGGKTLASQPLGADGRASLAANWAAGTYATSAAYNGDANYQASPPVPLTLKVAKAPTAMAVSSDLAQIAQPVMLHASVSLTAGTGTPTGTVDFSVDGTAVAGCTGIPLSGGTAACQSSFPQRGTFTLGGNFSGDSNTLASTATASVAVSKAVPGIYLAQSPATPVFGQTVTVNCLLMGATGLPTPTGAVTFASSGKTLATPAVGTDGRASWTSTLTAGNSLITATYSGDDNYQAPTPASLALTVSKAATVLTVSSDPAQIGQPVTVRAAVALTSGSGTISGTIDFSVGGKPLSGCTGIAVVSGAASCPTSFPQVGTFILGGSFTGDGNIQPATASAPVTVNRAVPGIYLAKSPAAPVFGQPVTLDGLVLGASGLPAPTGTVSFSDSGFLLFTQAAGADGHASVTAPLTVGTHSFTAAYNGDTNYQSVIAPPMAVTVTQAATATALTAATGGPFTAVVTAVAPGAGSPTGTVQFRSGSTIAGSVPVMPHGSTFTAVLDSCTATGSITAFYLGDSNFAASSSSAATVAPGQTVVTVSSDHNPSTVGQTVNFTVVVSITPQGASAAPTGTVTLAADGSDVGTAALANGQAALRASLATGSHTIAARYSGDASYPAASGTMVQVVGAAAGALAVASSAPVSVFGQPVTLTAQVQAQTGSVQFSEGATALGSAAITSGTASLAVNLPAGVHTITAAWAGASAQVVQTVNQAGTSLSLGISGAGLLATVAVSAPGAGSPGGTVRFVDAATSATLAVIPVANGTATAPLPPTANAVAAIYSGDANFSGATSATVYLLAVTNAASYLSGSVAADELVTLFGPNLAGEQTVKVTDSAGTSRNASLLFVSPSQTSILMPADAATGAATVSIVGPSRTLWAPVNISGVAPGLFTADGSGQGAPAAQVITVNADGTQNDPAAATAPIDLSNGVSVYLVLYGTGIRHSAAPPVCTIGGQPAQIVYAGAQGSMPGLDQVNVLIPASLASAGAAPLRLTVDGSAANTVTLSIR